MQAKLQRVLAEVNSPPLKVTVPLKFATQLPDALQLKVCVFLEHEPAPVQVQSRPERVHDPNELVKLLFLRMSIELMFVNPVLQLALVTPPPRL